MRILFFTCMLMMPGWMMAQPSIKVEVSADTVSPGEMVKISYTIEDGEGLFDGPDMYGLPLVSGPNTSSSVMIKNGKRKTSITYSYILMSSREALIEIPKAVYKTEDEELIFEPVRIAVISGAQHLADDDFKEKKALKTQREKQKI